jgi:HEAT repeat protein
MPRKRNTIKERLKEFQKKCANSGPDEVQSAVKKALRDRNCLIVNKAAVLCEEHLIYELEADLIKAYQRFLKNPVKSDPNCIAKEAIARALVELDCPDVDFFIAGLNYHQFEPTWGGSEDTAIDIRLSCAMGLVNTSYSRALIEVLALLHDSNPHVRRGIVQAIALTEPLAAEAVLRFKALAGDPEPDVTAETLCALLKVAPDESRDFVAKFLRPPNDEILSQSVAHALGASKVAEAVDILRSCWNELSFKGELGNAFLFGAILHRSEKAFAWLIELVEKGDRASAQYIVTEFAIYHNDQRLRKSLHAALVKRNDDAVTTLYNKIWRQQK